MAPTADAPAAHTRGVKAMLDAGVIGVPDSYVRPVDERPAFDNVRTTEDNDLEIPVVDVSEADKPERWADIVDQIGRASEEWGFFQVINHGIDAEKILKAVRRFYELPTAEKSLLPFGDAHSGVTFATGTGATRDWKDALVIRRRPGVCDGFPAAPEVMREEVVEYQVGLDKLAGLLYEAIFESLGLSAKEHVRSRELPGLERLVLVCNFYPPCPDPSVVFGQSAHSDLNSITLLLPDAVPGLQVRKGDAWVAVKPIPNAFVINIGDQIEIMSNAKYKSVEHRVVVNKDKSRISLAGLFGPCEDVKVGPLPALCSDDSPPLFREVLFSDYLLNYYVKGLPLYKTTLNYAGGNYSDKPLVT